MRPVHRNGVSRVIVFGLPLMLCWAGSGLGSTVRQLDTRELTLDSHDIVVGEVQSVRSYWNAAHTRIFTDVTVHVTRSLKGSAGSMLTLTELGGEVDGARLDVPGCPTFRPGQQSLLFVWRDSQGRAQVNGLAQGKFDIQADPSTGERTVQRAVPGFGAHDAKTLRVVPAGQPLPRLRLDDLVREITRTMAEESNR